jgi:hypothetical protein
MLLFDSGGRFYFVNRVLTSIVIELQHVNRGEQLILLKNWLKQRLGVFGEQIGSLLLCLALRARYQDAARKKSERDAFHDRA